MTSGSNQICEKETNSPRVGWILFRSSDLPKIMQKINPELVVLPSGFVYRDCLTGRIRWLVQAWAKDLDKVSCNLKQDYEIKGWIPQNDPNLDQIWDNSTQQNEGLGSREIFHEMVVWGPDVVIFLHASGLRVDRILTVERSVFFVEPWQTPEVKLEKKWKEVKSAPKDLLI